MATKAGLISNALILIGDLPLNSLTEDSYRAEVAVNLYDNIKLSELGKHRWGFARRKSVISQVVAALPDDEFRFVYQLPGDLVSLIKIYPNAYNYKIYGNQIYTNLNNLDSIDYITNVDEAQWPPHFSKMMEYALARDYAIPIRDSAASKESMIFEYNEQARNARFLDSQQHPQTSIRSMPFITARF